MARRAAGLTSSEGLHLEEHLGGCQDCRREASLLSGIRAIVREHETQLPASARRRAIAQALQQRTVTAERSASRVSWGVAFAGALAAAAAVLFVQPRAESPATAVRARPVGVEAPAPTAAEVVALQAGDRVRVARETHATLGHARVTLQADSDAQWDPTRRELALHAGVVQAEVDPSRQVPFAVVTARFRAEVLGTVFEVAQRSVRVSRGSVRVVTRDGVERAVLHAGERYDHADEPRALETQVAPARTDARALLGQARDALAADQLDRARTALDAALASALTRSARAEALSLRAEWLAARGDRLAAVDAYLEVARRFDELPAGENALFAAARMQPAPTAARALLERYLARYPQGRFVTEARKRLQLPAR